MPGPRPAREQPHHLALPVALVDVLDPEAPLEGLDQRVGHRDQAGRAHRVVGVVRARRLLPQEDVHGAQREDHGRAVVPAAVPELVHREARVDRAGHAADQRAVDARHPGRRLVHRQARVDHLALAQQRVVGAVDRRADPDVVALHHALRAAGRPRGPEDRGGVAEEELAVVGLLAGGALELRERRRGKPERRRGARAPAHHHALEAGPPPHSATRGTSASSTTSKLRAAVLQALAQPVALVVRAGGNPDRAELVEAERRPHVGGAALHQQRNGVAAPDAELLESARHRVRELVHAAVGPALVVRHQEIPVGMRLGLAQQAAAEQAVARVVEIQTVHGSSAVQGADSTRPLARRRARRPPRGSPRLDRRREEPDLARPWTRLRGALARAAAAGGARDHARRASAGPRADAAGRDRGARRRRGRPGRDRGMDGREPGLHGPHAAPDADRGRRRRGDHQGAPARRRLPAPVHGRRLEADRRAARRVLAAPLRRADGRRAAR